MTTDNNGTNTSNLQIMVTSFQEGIKVLDANANFSTTSDVTIDRVSGKLFSMSYVLNNGERTLSLFGMVCVIPLATKSYFVVAGGPASQTDSISTSMSEVLKTIKFDR